MMAHRRLFAAMVAAAFAAGAAPAQEIGEATPLATLAFLEGPAAAEDGSLYFTDLFNNRIWRRDAEGRLSVFRASANFANGLALDDDGNLYAAECGDPATGTPPRITRTNLRTGAQTVLVDGFEGKSLAGPNDLVVDDKGRVFFTDWSRPDFLPPLEAAPRNPPAVYRIDRDGSVHRLLAAPQIEAPNGVMLSPDDRTLYLVESNRAAGGRRRIDAYPVDPSGNLGERRLFHDFSPGRSGDGMAVDQAGRVWVAAGLNAPRAGGETLDTRAGVYVFAPDGRRVAFVPVREDLVTNVAFGGPGRRTAFVTAGKTILTILSDAAGTRR